MYNVNFSGGGAGLGAMQPMEEKLWVEVPGEDYKGGKFVREAYIDPETGAAVEMGEQIKALQFISPPVAGEEAAKALVAELLAQYGATAAELKARGIAVGEPKVVYGCDDNMCVATADYYIPVRTWVSRKLFDVQDEAKAHADETKRMLEEAGWNVVDTDVSREETGWFHVAHDVDVSPLYLALETPEEGETIMPPIISEEEEMELPTTAVLTRGQKIGLGVAIGVAGAVIIGGIVTAVVLKRRAEEPALAGYGEYGYDYAQRSVWD